MTASRNDAVRDAVCGELTGIVQVPRLTIHLPGLLVQPRGHGETVVVMPGRSNDDISTLPLRTYLRILGYRSVGWGLGPNHGRIKELLPLAIEATAVAAERQGSPVALVGQSMGGYVAREVARCRPDLVDRVVTLGTPIFAPQSRSTIECPVTAIFSRSDRIVGTGRSIDSAPTTRNVEVHSTHFAMGIDPDVWRAVVAALGTRSTDSDDGG